MPKTINGRRGFTLVELLVVIAIIGVLSTLAAVALNSARQKSRDAKRVADVKAIQLSLELYYSENNGYPNEDPAVELGVGDYRALCTGGFKDACASGDTVYMGLIPSKPTPWDGTCTSDENRYMYMTPSGAAYEITFCTGGGVGDLAAGTHTATEDGIQ